MMTVNSEVSRAIADNLMIYTELMNHADAILYGRITYELMEVWQPFVKNPSGENLWMILL
jgi:hypothetical protein